MPRLFIHKFEERYAPDSTVNNRAVQLYLFLATASIFLLTLLSVLPKRSPFLWLFGSISMRGYSWCDFFFLPCVPRVWSHSCHICTHTEQQAGRRGVDDRCIRTAEAQLLDSLSAYGWFWNFNNPCKMNSDALRYCFFNQCQCSKWFIYPSWCSQAPCWRVSEWGNWPLLYGHI